MASIPVTSPAELRARMHYDPATGALTWTRPECPRLKPGAPVGTTRQDGYVFCKIRGDRVPKGRVIWAYMTGEWPPADLEIDHRDRDVANYTWENLRCASDPQNTTNRGLQKNNTSGHPGVKQIGRRWRARIYASGTEHHLGMFATREGAIAAYEQAAIGLHGEFRRNAPHGPARWERDAPGAPRYTAAGEPADA